MPSPRNFLHIATCAASVLLACEQAAESKGEDEPLSEEASNRLEQLVNKEVVFSPRLEEEVFNSPSGSYVFDANDISRLPVDSIPELLRYAPGVHIVRPSNGIWGVGIRGINSRFFNRVLFTVDEQSVYATIFAGLFGSQHDLLLEDVSTIEVAYGPGGGTWDNNAVNGMVNVRMKTAFETEGSLLKLTVGSEQNAVAARTGWAISEDTAARMYAKASRREASLTRFDYSNAWETARTGFRVDHRPSSTDLFSVSGEAFFSDLGYAFDLANFEDGSLSFRTNTEQLRGANAQLKWTRNTASGGSHSVRSWLSYSELDAAYAAFDIWTAGVEARSERKFGDSHLVSINLGAAADREDTASTEASDFTHPRIENHALYWGIQDDWTLAPDFLTLSLGADFRHDDRTSDITFSPNLRLLLNTSDKSRLWFSYSQANRVQPVSLSVIESLRSGTALDEPITVDTPSGPRTIEHSLTNAISSEELEPDQLDAFEAGLRVNFNSDKGSFSFNAYSYQYDNIAARIGISSEPVLTTPIPHIAIEGSYENLLKGEAHGFEVHIAYKLDTSNQIRLNYALQMDSFQPLVEPASAFQADSIDFFLREFDNSTPEQIITLNYLTSPADNWEFDAGFRYTEGYEFSKGGQPSIFQLDTRLTWQKSERLRLSLVGRNLLDPYTQDVRLKDFFGHWAETSREVYLEISAQF